METRSRCALAVLVVLSGAAFLVLAAGDDPPAAALDRARQTAQQLRGELMKNLTAALKEGGAANGVGVCSEIAPGIAAGLSRDGVTVHRVTTKPRNPRNVPDAWEAAQLAALAAAHAKGNLPAELSEVVTDAGGRRELRYVTPLTISGPCLQCHGSDAQIDPQVKKLLAEKYPADQATGYQPGDLRGVISVRVALP